MEKKRKRSILDAYRQSYKGIFSPRSVLQPREYSSLMICGYDVKLPYNLEPYKTQKAMIAKVLTSLKNRLSALIESPTGSGIFYYKSGKTLALLSSTCAWLAKYKDERAKSREECQVCNGKSRTSDVEDNEINNHPEDSTVNDSNLGQPENQSPKPLTVEEEFELDFSPSVLQNSAFGTDIALLKAKRMRAGEAGDTESFEGHTCLPKVVIYYGTRTHKQIGQVVKEFSRLPYGHSGVLKHTILASREHTCINKMVFDGGGDLQAKCVEITGPKGIGCPFKNAARGKYEKSFPVRNLISKYSEHPDDVWDVEDLVKILTISNPSICPYVTMTRVLTGDADIVFCPFNYMLDPIIRDNSDVNLKNAIIVLDEAHNVEDVCRESTSFAFTEREIVSACMEFRRKSELFFFEDLGGEVDKVYGKILRKTEAAEGVVDDYLMEQNTANVESYRQLNESFKMLNMFMNDVLIWFAETAKDGLKRAPSKNGRIAYTFSWETLYTSLQERNFMRFQERGCGSALVSLIKALTDICGANEHADTFKPNASAIVCVEKFVYFFRIYFTEDYRTCYKLFVCAEKPHTFVYFGHFCCEILKFSLNSSFNKVKVGVSDMAVLYNKDENLWMDSRTPLSGYKEIMEGCKISFELWCMRPALAYLDAFKCSRSVILASGTLSPMDTFKSELGVEFQQQMEGSQVIPAEQIFAAVIPTGPNGYHLRATYKNINSDNRLISELSLVLRAVCEKVPKGILCFVSSYRLLDQLYDYMLSSGILRQIMTVKHVLREPRRSSQMNEVMAEYQKAVDCPKRFGTQCTGVLLFAVFRGKVSEGIDFADDRARCVISIGIPFPNAIDEQVQEKKRYNDDNCKKMQLLTGDNWYIMQAYRALNQALGRCLRHRNDWGIILLLDDRLLQNRSNPDAQKVSRWIREQLRKLSGYNDFLTQLECFVNRMSLIGDKKILHEGEVEGSEKNVTL
uniref:DNA helicase n=1 Tax=Syphacia muris TaxID=451379 RepID=A0A0N5AJL4_9BILA